MEVTNNRAVTQREPGTETETGAARVLHRKAVEGTAGVVLGVVVCRVPRHLADRAATAEPRVEAVLAGTSGDPALLPDGAPRPADKDQYVQTEQPFNYIIEDCYVRVYEFGNAESIVVENVISIVEVESVTWEYENRGLGLGYT